MMDEAISVGKNALVAYRCVRQLYRDTVAMISAIDLAISEHQWTPTLKSKISSELRNRLQANCWNLSSAYRIYAKTGSAKEADQIVAIHIMFDPPDCYSEPICLCVVGKFPRRTSTKDIWDKWTDKASGILSRALAELEPTEKVMASAIKLFPAAEKANAFAIPLCDLKNEAEVNARLVERALQLLETLHS